MIGTRTVNASISEGHARRLALALKDTDFNAPEAEHFLKSHGFAKKKTAEGSYWKMKSRDCFLIPRDLFCTPSCPKVQRWGTTLNGMFLTARVMESCAVGKECSLADILEKNVPQKYFLTKKEAAAIIAKTLLLKGIEYLKSRLKPGWNIADFRNDEGLRVRKELISPSLRAATEMCPIYLVYVPVGEEAPLEGSYV